MQYSSKALSAQCLYPYAQQQSRELVFHLNAVRTSHCARDLMMSLQCVCLLVAVLSSALSLSVVTCQDWQTHFITPDYSEAPCSSHAANSTCFTLSDYVGLNATERFPSNTAVTFLPGIHYLDAIDHVVIRDVSNLVLRGLETPVGEAASSHIVCTAESGFLFMNISDIEIANLTFSLCGTVLSPEVLDNILTVQTKSFVEFTEYESIALFIVNVHSLHVSNIVIQNSTGLGLLGINTLGDSIIENSTFLSNNFYTIEDPLCQDLDIENPTIDLFRCTGGGAYFMYSDLHECPEAPLSYQLTISSCHFTYGVSLVPYKTGSGLSVILTQSSYGIDVVVKNTTFSKNSGRIGANMAFVLYDVVDNSTITVQDCYSGESNFHFTPNVKKIISRDHTGGGLHYRCGDLVPSSYSPSCQVGKKSRKEVLKVYNTDFVDNTGVVGAGISIQLSGVDSPEKPFVIEIRNCKFINNFGSPGSAIIMVQDEPLDYNLVFRILITNCVFSDNRYPISFLPNSIQHFELDLTNTVYLHSVQDITFADCEFYDNVGTALYAYGTKLRFSGKINIERNYGVDGGGLSLHGDSIILLSHQTHVGILNNRAQRKGGGIFVTSQNIGASLPCFFQIDLHNLTSSIVENISSTVDVPQALDIQVTLDSNAAMIAGTAIFGSEIDNCNVITTSMFRRLNNSTALFDQLFQCGKDTCSNNNDVNSSVISSKPFRVCFCDPLPNCSITTTPIAIYPGQTFAVHVVSLGQRNGTSPGVIFADFIFDNGSIHNEEIIGAFQQAQQVGDQCTELQYTIFWQPSTSELEMILTMEDSAILEDPTFVAITLRPCPPGFALSEPPFSCQCDPFLDRYDIPCDINNETVHRTHPQWIGIDLFDNHSERGLLFLTNCPFDYCVTQEINLNLSNPDEQCAFNRTGVLCGACQPGLSVTLGGSECRQCSNAYLALLLPFALAGLCLVLLLFVCNTLTVAVGTLNGLIFYANILQFNQSIYFPPGESNILTVFISWLNLDLGIHTCFYDGMDTYSKVWLQFVFPIYIWAIAIIIIIISHYSMRVANLAGEHSVPVLATLFLLSFAKVLRTIIFTLSFTVIRHSHGKITASWIFDANLRYLEEKHVPLFLFAAAILLFLAIPFILVLAFAPLLQKKSSHKALKWVNKLKPFFDAYQGPYKDNHRSWTGVLLFVRGLLFLIYSFNILQRPGVVLLVTIIMAFLLTAYGWISGGMYRVSIINVLELSFFINLSLLSAASLYVRYAGGSQEAVVYTSTSIALVVFVGTVIYSISHRLGVNLSQSFFKNVKERVGSQRADQRSNADTVSREDVSAATATELPTISEHERHQLEYQLSPPERAKSFSTIFRESMFEDMST